MHLRAQLMIEVEAILKARKMPHMEAVALFGVSQPRVSDLLCGWLDRFTLDKLINWLTKLARRVDVVILDGGPSLGLV